MAHIVPDLLHLGTGATVGRVPRHGPLARALARPGFRRLLATRLAGQFGDGVFQASLAGVVLFDPTREARAADVAAGFIVVLLPYSLVGPFAGVLLDRWWRQRVLVVANVLRALFVVGVAAEIAGGLHGQPFYASALVVVSVNRFFLSALSASLPHVIDTEELVNANGLTTTMGALATTAGGAAAIGLRVLLGGSYAPLALAAALPYLASAAIGRGFGRTVLGPDDVERTNRETLAMVARGLVAGAQHIRTRPTAARALTMIGLHRFCYGVSTVCTLLLFRNYFHDEGFFRAGLAGLAQVVIAAALGSGLAAVVTPLATRTLGFVRWPVVLLFLAASLQIGLGLPYRLPLMVLAAFGLGFAAQAIKINVDTVVQREVLDEFRGRVFSLYDTLFNLTFVSAAVVTALVLPDTGHAPWSVLALGAGYALTGAGFARTERRPAEVG